MSNGGSLEDRLLQFDYVLEIGIGQRPDLADRLAQAGVTVTAVDCKPREVSDEVTLIVGDIFDLSPQDLPLVDAIYARNLPAELQRRTLELARARAAPVFFTTLGTELPIIPTELLSGDVKPVYFVSPCRPNDV